MGKLSRDRALLVIIDVQERLMPVIHGREEVELNIDRLIRGCAAFQIPVVVTEQYVKGLGPTVAPLRSTLEECGVPRPIEKMTFSAWESKEFVETLTMNNPQRRQVMVGGVETHVCVHQTVTDLLAAGFEVTLIADALSSRSVRNRDIALERMTGDGALLSSTEMALLELTATSGTEDFKLIARLIK